MEVIAREPRANAAFLKLPRSGQPPRPRPVRHRHSYGPKRPGIGLYHLAWQVDTIDELAGGAAGARRGRRARGRVEPRRHQEPLRPGPRRPRVRGAVDAAARRVGRVRERAPRSSGSTCAATSSAGPASRTADELRPLLGRPSVSAFARAGRRHRRVSTDPQAPLVVLLHGRGSHEGEIIGLAPHLPRTSRTPRCARRSPRAAASRGSRTAASAARCRSRCARRWTGSARGSTRRPADRPVVLVGFSGGAAFAGGLLLDDPARYAGAASCSARCRSTPACPRPTAGSTGARVLAIQGDAGHVIPRELLDRTWAYLTGASGADVDDAPHSGRSRHRRRCAGGPARLAHRDVRGARVTGISGELSRDPPDHSSYSRTGRRAVAFRA